MITVKEIEQRMIDDFTTLEAFNYAKTNQPDAVVEELTDRLDDNVDINNIDLDKVDFEITQSYLLTPVYEVAESEQEFIESIGDYTTYFNRYFYERLVTKYSVTVDIEIKNLDDLLYGEE